MARTDFHIDLGSGLREERPAAPLVEVKVPPQVAAAYQRKVDALERLRFLVAAGKLSSNRIPVTRKQLGEAVSDILTLMGLADD